MRVVPDHTQGEWTELADGVRAVRTFTVHELAGVSSAQLKAAAEAVGVPARNDPHPEDSSILMIEKSARPLHDTAALVTCRYEIPTWQNSPETVAQEITIDATVIEEKTYFDYLGTTRISVTYTTGAVITQYPSATTAASRVTATIRKVETTSESDLLLRAADFVETVNDAMWFNWPEKTWKLDDLQSRPSRLSGRREVTYVLTYNPRDWRFLATLIDKGRVPPDATEGNGFRRWDTREPKDFTLLPITVPTKP